jgi:hypothetical protein
MMARLGRAIWWLGALAGGLFFAWWWHACAVDHPGGVNLDVLTIGAVIAAIPIGFGWLCRYVLSGETRIIP